jgi:hypothetical protein
MVAPNGRQGEWNLPLWNVAALYCVKTLFGGLDITKDSEEIMLDLLGETPTFSSDASHSKEWKDLQFIITENPNYKTKLYSECLAYFSKSVGAATPGETVYKIVDATEIIKCIEKLKEIKWNLSGVCPEDATEAKNTWFYSASFINKFVASVRKLIDSEKNEANNYLNFFNLLFDKHFDEQTIDASIKETQDFLKFINEQLNLGYKVEDYISLNDTKASKILSKELENLNRLMAVNEHSEMLCLFSMNPFDKVIKYFDTFVKLNLLLEDKHTLFSASVDNESKDKIAEHKKNITTKISDMVCNLETIGGASNGNN